MEFRRAESAVFTGDSVTFAPHELNHAKKAG
jgi:hypothetical protein